MISKKIIAAILKAAKEESKDMIITMFIENLNRGYSYNDPKVNNVLEILVDPSTVKTTKDINIDYIKNNLRLLMYDPDKYNIKDITLIGIDNIDCEAIIKYKYLEKINEDRGDVDYNTTETRISFLDYPEMLNYS